MSNGLWVGHQSLKVGLRSVPSPGVHGPSLGHCPGLGASSPRKVFLILQAHVLTLLAKKLPLVFICMRLLGLMVTSFKAVMFAQFHTGPLQLSADCMGQTSWISGPAHAPVYQGQDIANLVAD